MPDMHERVLAGHITVPVHLTSQDISLAHLCGCHVAADGSTPQLLLLKSQHAGEPYSYTTAVAMTDPVLIMHTIANRNSSNLQQHQQGTEQANTTAEVEATGGSGSGSSSNSRSCLQDNTALLAGVVWGLVHLEYATSADSAAQQLLTGQSSSNLKGLNSCRSRVKAVQQLLQLNLIQLRVAATVPLPQHQQQQQQNDKLQLLPDPAPASAVAAAAAPTAVGKKRSSTGGSNSKRRRSSGGGTSAAAAAAAPVCSGWVHLEVWLMPELFYTPGSNSDGNSMVRQQSTQLQAGLTSWSLQTDLEQQSNAAVAAADTAVNNLMAMLLDSSRLSKQQQQQQHQQQHQQQQHQQQEASLDGHELHDRLTDLEYQQILTDYKQHYQQQLQPPKRNEGQVSSSTSSTAVTAAAAAAAAATAAEQHYDTQFGLLSCPETAAAASTDIRQSLFDWVNPAAWGLQADDPPGLQCKMFRYQKRALAWMMWREQHGTDALGFSSSSSSSSSSTKPLWRQQQQQQGRVAAAAAEHSRRAISEAQGILGAQLLNPLWQDVRLTVPSNHDCSYESCRQQQQQQQHDVVLYHAVSHGLVSRVRPAGFSGPAGGILCDEMGLGKTVEVLALLLARPPPTHFRGKKGASRATAADNSDDDEAGLRNGHVMNGVTNGRHVSSGSRQQPWLDATSRQLRTDPNSDQYRCDNFDVEEAYNAARQHANAAAAAKGAAAGPKSVDWPAPGKWGGATLVVTPPAILQQWANEVKRHSPELRVVIYDGLKWQRAQAEATTRRQQGRQSKAQRAAAAQMELYSYLSNGPPDKPAFDAEADAAECVQQLLDGDLVITTYDVLQQEVHFSGNKSERLHSLRHEKRYKIPESPLLQVHWWRAVFDEAQLVGAGLSSTAVMASHLTTQHRWAVTGTPIGAGGLDDVGNLLRLIGASPFDSTYVFRKAILEPFAASVAAAAAVLQQHEQQQHSQDVLPFVSRSSSIPTGQHELDVVQYGRSERDGVRRLLALLQPLMWRSNKQAAAADHPLPPRHLQKVLLRFSPAEQSFYDHIVEKTAAAKQELQQQQQERRDQEAAAAVAAAAAADGSDVQHQQQQPKKRAGARGRGRGKGESLDKQLQTLAGTQLLQLRLACLHPQLTSYWRELSSELQLMQGGALSISEILGRMRDGAQLKLQATERELCLTLNGLACKLLEDATAAAEAEAAQQKHCQARGTSGSGSSSSSKGKKRRKSAAAAAGEGESDVDDELWAPGSSREAAAAGGGSSSARPRKRVRFSAAAAADSDNDSDMAVEPEEAVSAAAAAAGGGSGSSSARKRRGSSSGNGSGEAVQSADDLRRAALKLLEDSYQVGEHGIAALTRSSTDQPEPLGDISGGDATWRAWKHVGLHTAQSLVQLCAQLDLTLKTELYTQDLNKKRKELLETPALEVTKAVSKLQDLQDRVALLGRELAVTWEAAAGAAVPMADMTGSVDAAAWIASLQTQLSAAQEQETATREQRTNEEGKLTTTVLLGQHVPKLLEGLESAAAADRTLAEGIVGQVHVRKVAALLRSALSVVGGVHGTVGRIGPGSSSAAAAAAAAPRVRFAAGVVSNQSKGAVSKQDRDYMPSDDDMELHSEEELLDEAPFRPKKLAAAPAAGTNGGSKRAQDGAAAVAAAAWAANSGAAVRLQDQAAAAAAAAGSGQGLGELPALVAARAATYQFLDCLPERRVLWRLLYKGSLTPTPQQQQQQQEGDGSRAPPSAAAEGGQSSAGRSSSSSSSGGGGLKLFQPPTVTTPASVATALGALLTVYAAAAHPQTQQQTLDLAGQDLNPAAAAGLNLTATQTLNPEPVVESFAARVVRTQADLLWRGQLLRRLGKKGVSYQRAVDSAAAAAAGGAEHVEAAAAEVAEYMHQQQQQQQNAQLSKVSDQGLPSAAEQQEMHCSDQKQAKVPDHAAAAAAAAAAGADSAAKPSLSKVPNIPLLLQLLPLEAVAAAAEAARIRVELIRVHKEVHVAELGLELAQHSKQLVEEEADTAAAGQLPQVLALTDRPHSELCKSISDLTKKCDDLLRHKRFLANQADESSAFSKLKKVAANRSEQPAAAAGAAAAAAGAGELHSELALMDLEDQDEDALECAVCKSSMSDELQVFPCGHYFCDTCAQQQLSGPSPSCAYCRKHVSKSGVFRVSLAGSGAHDPELDPPEGPAVKDIKVTGTWMTKLEALLRRLLLLRQQEPGAKSLVFSQFPDALLLASKALDVVQIKYVSLGLGGGRDNKRTVRDAIRKFSEDPEVCVFLLSLRAGAAGLTLTAASRVFLLEPGLDPAIEQQAVARVHRIGQEKEVIISRLIVQGSVEEQVLQISEDKQALLAEAAHQQQQQQGHDTGSSKAAIPAAAAAAARSGQGESDHRCEIDQEDDDELFMEDKEMPGDTLGRTLGDTSLTGKQRRRSSVGGTAGATSAAPTTLQGAAPKREAVGKEEVVGLLAAVMKQRGKD